MKLRATIYRAPTNQIESVTENSATVNYTYDAAGNVTDDDVNTYVYDAENRLVSVNSGAQTYKYDHQNRRIEKTVGSTTTHYVWEGGQVIAEHAASTGNVLVDYVFVGGRMVYKVESGVVKYFLSDRLSVRLMLSEGAPLTGEVTVEGKQSHLPFGEEIATSGDQDKHHFTSYEREASLGLDYAVNRWHSPGVGRFLQVDPMSGSVKDPQTLNRYSYVRNNPINFTDPLGLFLNPAESITCRLVGIVVLEFREPGPEGGEYLGEVTYGIYRCSASGGGGGSSEPPLPDDNTEWDDRLTREKYEECRNKVFGQSNTAGLLNITGLNGDAGFRATKLMLFAGGNSPEITAMVGAIWAKESNFLLRPTGDHGPAQLTGWWWNNRRYLIEPGAYDVARPGRQNREPNGPRPFEGNVKANVLTLGNIVTFLFNHHRVYESGDWSRIPYWYGPGTEENPRDQYANEVMSAVPLFRDYANCLTSGS